MNRWQKTKSILFDFGGTLDSDGINWKERFYPLYRLAGLDWDFKKFEKYFYASDDFLTAMRLKKESFSQTLEMQVSLVLKNGKAYKKDLAERIALSFLKSSLENIRRNIELLAQLKKKYSMGIVSNFYGNLPFICRELGLEPFFDVVVDSSVVGCLKPDPRIFFEALRTLRAEPNDAVFVGDSPHRDMAGSKSIGMPHIWMRPSMDHPEEVKKNVLWKYFRKKYAEETKPCCRGDAVVHSLLDLRDILLRGK